MSSGKACEGDNDNLRDCAVAVKERSSEEWIIVLRFSEYSSGYVWTEKAREKVFSVIASCSVWLKINFQGWEQCWQVGPKRKYGYHKKHSVRQNPLAM